MNTKLQELLSGIRKVTGMALFTILVISASLMLPANEIHAQRKNTIKVFTAFFNNLGKPYNFRTSANDYKQFKFAVVSKRNVFEIKVHF